MKQTLIFRSRSTPANTVTDFSSVLCPMDFGGNETFSKVVWLPEGTFSNMIMTIDVAPGTLGSGKSWTFTLRRSAASFGAMADTTVTVPISETATTGRDTTHSFTTPAGGCFLALKWVPVGTPAALSSTGVEMSIEFDSANPKESGHCYFPYLLGSTAGKRNGLFSNTGTSWTTNAGGFVASVAAVPGVLSGLGLFLPEGAQGGTDHVTVVIYKNSVKQDGTGGTVNTTTDLGPSDARKIQSFSLPVSPGDYFWLETTVMSTFGVHIAVGVLFTATSDGQSNFCGQSGNLNTGINPAFLEMEGGGRTWTSTEVTATGAANHGGVTTFALSGLQLFLEVAPGSSKTWTFTQRRNGGDAAPTVAITGAAIQGSDTAHSSTIADGDTLALKAVPTSSPAVGNMSWAMIQRDSVTVTVGLANAMLLVSP